MQAAFQLYQDTEVAKLPDLLKRAQPHGNNFIFKSHCKI